MEKINEIYTSERKILDRLQITDERAVALLLDAGYKSVGEARDACGRDLGFRIALLSRIGELERHAKLTDNQFAGQDEINKRLLKTEPAKGK